MMRMLIFAWGVLALGALPAQVATRKAPQELAAAIAGKVASSPDGELWPGFNPGAVPLAIFDGKQTWVFRHPKQLPGYAPGPIAGSQVKLGRDSAITANTSAQMGDVATATLLLTPNANKTPDELAAVAIHEAFHVYQRAQHPKWSANEADVFTYPVENADLLTERRVETLALGKALAANTSADRACWSRAALAARTKRFGAMSNEHVAYERGTELNEGLANFVQSLAAKSRISLPQADFPAGAVRLRAYGTGAAIATLLDTTGLDWKADLERNDAQSLEELLAKRLGSGMTCEVGTTVRGQLAKGAVAAVAELKEKRAHQLAEFEAMPGWRLRVLAGSSPLWPQGFDPLNIELVKPGSILHTRFVKLGNDGGQVEVLGHPALSIAAGVHPLFEGIKELEVAGLVKPKITRDGTTTVVDAGDTKLRFANAKLLENGEVIVVQLP